MAFRFFQRRPAGADGELLGCKLKEVGKDRSSVLHSGLESRLGSRLCETVPRTNLLANVTTEDPISHGRVEFVGNLPLLFNSEIGNAAPGVQDVGRHDSLSRAGFNAAGASAAIIFDRDIVDDLPAQKKDPQEYV